MNELQVYISDECWSCEVTVRIVADVAPQFPSVEVALLNTTNTQLPDGVFATPTYVLNGRIIFLGNPTREELCNKLLAVQQTFQI
ncbi:MAG: hypothetical protein GY796_20430 [Chloroflexi bacterium]|nr:hypothetical protein [Chloroflexota bacterium]